MPEINSVESDHFYESACEIVKMTNKNLEKNTDFFFIKELQDALNDIGLEKIAEDLDLGNMHFKSVVDKKQIFRTDYSDMVEQVLKTLTCLTNQFYSESQSIKTIADSVKKFTEKYKFLNYIEISDTPDSEGFYIIRALPDINNVFSVKIAEALEKIIREVSISTEWQGDKSFIDAFINELGEKQLSNIKKIGVNLNNIKTKFFDVKYDIIMKKALDSLVKIVGEKTHDSFAVATLDDIINKNYLITSPRIATFALSI